MSRHKHLVFILVLLLALVVNCLAATEVVKIVDPDNGAGTDYTSLSSWESGEQRNLPNMQKANTSNHSGTFSSGESLSFSPSGATGVMIETDNSSFMRYELSSGTPSTGDTISGNSSGASCHIDSFAYQDGEIAIAKCRCTSGSADTTAVTIDGWTTDADHYIKIWTDPNEGYRHDGKWNTSKYRLDTGPVSDGVITILENYVRLLGLQLKASGAGDCRGVCVNANGSDSEIRIGYCLIWMQPESGYYADGIRVSDEVNGAINVKVFNTIIWDCFK